MKVEQNNMPHCRIFLLRALAAVFLYVACGLAAQSPQPNRAEDLLAVLNTKDQAAILAYLKAQFTTKVPAEERLERVMGLVGRGAPFKLVKVGAKNSDEERYLIEDRSGERLTLTAKLAPDGRIAALLLTDPESFEAKPAKDYRGWTNLQKLADELRVDTECPAIGIAVIRSGKLETAVAGLRETGKTASVQPDDPWSVGSIGKPLCSSVVAILIDDGKLSWNSTLGELLPDMAASSPYAPVTVEQVMRHCGGIPQVMGLRRPEVERIVGNAKTPSEIRANFVKDTIPQPPIGKPGERFAYSNAGYAILALIAERLAGKPYEDLLRERIFKPLGLTHSFIGSATWPEARPMGHVPGPKGLEPAEMTGPMESMMAGAGGGIYMSVGDLARFGEAHLKGLKGQDGIWKAETVKHLHAVDPHEKGEWYACGWGIEEHPGAAKFHGHNGSNGTFRAQLAVFPESDLVIACMVNRGGETDPSPPLQGVLAVAQKYSKP
jgi:CubicO group peptidase (beta-lactamase class C family)